MLKVASHVFNNNYLKFTPCSFYCDLSRHEKVLHNRNHTTFIEENLKAMSWGTTQFAWNNWRHHYRCKARENTCHFINTWVAEQSSKHRIHRADVYYARRSFICALEPISKYARNSIHKCEINSLTFVVHSLQAKSQVSPPAWHGK